MDKIVAFEITRVVTAYRGEPVKEDVEFFGMNVHYVLGELKRRDWKIDRVVFGAHANTENIVELRKGFEGESFMRICAKVN